MPLSDSLTADQYTSLGESDRALYVKGDGDNYSLHASVAAERTALSTKNQQLLAEKKLKEDALKPFLELGIDAAKAKEIIAAHEQAEAAKLTEEERRTKETDQLKTQHGRAIDDLTKKSGEREQFLSKELRKHLITAIATEAIREAEGEPEALLPHIERHLDMLEEGEGDQRGFVTRVVGADRQPRIADGVGTPFTVKQLVEEFKKKPAFMGLFKASRAGGSGASAVQNRAAASTTRTSTEQMSATEKIAQGLQNRAR